MPGDIVDYVFDGKFSFAFVTKLDRYHKNSVNFYPKNAEDRRAIKNTGTRCSVKEDENGEFYYKFATDEHPKDGSFIAVDGSGSPITVLVGNGSEGRVKFTVEKFTSPTYGEIARTRLVAVVVDKLIPYEKKEEHPAASPTEGVAEAKSSRMPF